MKKKLLKSLVVMFTMGVAGTAFAADKVTDVPANHWAYVAVKELVRVGIIDGDGDGKFRGDRNMSRYEMAQVVNKAMMNTNKATAAQKALVDKLAIEFAMELNKLDGRVASLEKKVGTVKLTGDARVRWNSGNPNSETDFKHRFRMNMAADVNENTSVFTRLQYAQETVGDTQKSMEIPNMELTTKNLFDSGATLTVGRFGQKIDTLGYTYSANGFVDGVKVGFGKDLKMTVGIANFSKAFPANGTMTTMDDAYFATATYKTSKVTEINAGYIKEAGGAKAVGTNDVDVWTAGIVTKVAKDLVLNGEYGENKAAASKKAKFAVAKLAYKQADVNKQGTWGLNVEYYHAQDGSIFGGYTDYGTGNSYSLGADKKAYALTGSYTVAKNIMLNGYQTFKTKKVSTGADMVNYSRLQLDYSF